MIYLDNNTQQQECWIPRQDILSGHSGGGGGGSYQEGYNDGVAHQKSLLATTAFTQNGEYTRLNGWSGVSVNVPQTGSTARLEEKTVVISADTTNVHPSIGFDGMSAVTVDAEAYAQENYDSGFDDGFNDGISSGYTEGYDSGFTSGYTSGYTSGSTDGFQSGYTSGETVGYNSGYTFGYGDGYADGSIDGYNNGYPDGYNSGYTSGYSSGYTVGFGEGEDRGYEDGIIDGRYEVEQTFTSMTATTNGEYGSSAHPLSAITVDVPQTGTSIPLSSITITANTAVTVVDKAYTGITVNVQQSSDIEPNKSFTATSNGNYTIHPSSALTVVDGDDIDNTYYMLTATTSGYPSSGIYEILRIEDTYDASIGYIQIFVNNGDYIYDITNWNGGDIVDCYGNVNGVLYFKIQRLIVGSGVVSTPKYIYGSDHQIVFDAMSEVSLNVNVQQNVEPSKSLTATTNGIYTIDPSYIWQITYDDHMARRYDFTINGTIPQSEVGNRAFVVSYYDENTGEEPSVSIFIGSGNTLTINKNNWDEDDYGRVDFVLFQGKYELEFDQRLDDSQFSIMPYDDGVQYDAMSSVTFNVNVPTGSSATLGEGSFSANGVYSAITDNLDGYSAITINVPQIGGRKYVEYIETDGTRVGWDTGLKVGSENSSFNIELDFMPLSGTVNDDAFYTFICDASDSDVVNIYGRTFGLGYKINNFNIQLGNLSNNYRGLSFNNRYNLVYDYESSSGKIILDETTILSSNSVTLQSKSDVKTLHINTWFYQGVVRRCPPARYYKVKITIDGVEHIFNPCLDSNNVPCFYDEYNNSYLYSIGTGNTPTAGPIVPSPEYNSGHTQGMKDALEDSFYGAYYPVDSATSGSYYTVFPTLESGQKLYFDIVVYTAQNAPLLGNNLGNLYLSMKTSDGVDLRVADSNGLSGATLHTYWLEYYRPNQNPYSRNISRVCGEVSVTSGECKTALDTGGAWLEEIATSGDFSLQYPVTFNTSCVSGLVLNSLVYKDVQTNETIHHFKLNPETLEMEDYFNDNTVAPTYNYIGNLVSGVLEPRQFRF